MSVFPVLYLEETMSDNTTDWRLCVRYGGDDTYEVYGSRWDGNSSQFRFRFLSRQSLFTFLTTVICKESNVSLTLYNVDRSDMLKENFVSYYESYNTNDELVGYDNLSFKEYRSDLMKYLLVLRDSRSF